MSAFEKIPNKIPLAKIVEIANCNFNCKCKAGPSRFPNFNCNCKTFTPIQTQDEDEDEEIDLCTAMPPDGRCAPNDPRAHRTGPDYMGSPWYTPVPGATYTSYTPVWRPDSPFWPGQYDGGVYICHECECTHADGICPGALPPSPQYDPAQYVPSSPLQAPTPTYDLSDDEEHVQAVVEALMGEPKDSKHYSRHCCGCGMARTRFHYEQCPYVPGRPDAKRKAHFEGMYLTRKKRACVDCV
jgi:hypothetical protein